MPGLLAESFSAAFGPYLVAVISMLVGTILAVLRRVSVTECAYLCLARIFAYMMFSCCVKNPNQFDYANFVLSIQPPWLVFAFHCFE